MSSARSKAHTEAESQPEDHHGIRPTSSHDLVREEEEILVPPDETIRALAKHLEIPLNTTSVDLDWVVRDCLISLREQGWALETASIDANNDLLVFRHVISGEKRSETEISATYRELARQVVYEREKLEDRRLDPHFQIAELVLDRLRRKQDPRYLANPPTIETILSHLKIDAARESYLVPVVIEELKSAFFKMESQGGPAFVDVDNAFSVQHLRTRIALARIRYMLRFAHAKLLFCVECKARLADGSCASCGDCLCDTCFSQLHDKGNRRDHLFVFMEQTVCSECEVRGADIRCSDCGDLFCRTCLSATHKVGKRVKHCLQLALPVFCLNCDIKEARLLCLECHDALCLECAQRLHRRGVRMNHTLYGIKNYAYPSKLHASNMTDIMIILDKILQFQRTPEWFAFREDQTGPYWYNFSTRTTASSEPPSIIDSDELLHDAIKARASWEAPPRIQVSFISDQ